MPNSSRSKLRALVAATVNRPARPSSRSSPASHNELATDLAPIPPAFTPGPWMVSAPSASEGVKNDGVSIRYAGPSHRWHIADVYGNDGGVAVGVHHHGQRNANARLIAAAPDGYDFAARFEAAGGFLVAGLPANHAVAKDLLGLRDVARAYLAKARGE